MLADSSEGEHFDFPDDGSTTGSDSDSDNGDGDAPAPAPAPGSAPLPNDLPEDEEEVGVVEIVDHRLREGDLSFYVFWLDGDVTWEPLTSVEDCEALDVYLMKHKVVYPWDLPVEDEDE